MTPASCDLPLYQGEDLRLAFRIREEGALVDLRPLQFAGQIRTHPGAETKLADVAVEVDAGDPTLGYLVVPRAVTAALPATPPTRPHVWDLFITNPAGEVSPYLAGSVPVRPRVTR